MDDKNKWHWEHGIKFATEGIKSLLLLNGGAAVALLAFWGNRQGQVGEAAIGNALVSFGVGALAAVVVFFLAYLTQLNYGNHDGAPKPFHYASYTAFFLSALSFMVGLWFARVAIQA